VRVIVDTTVWSLALRRRPADLSTEETAITLELSELIRENRVELIGAVRQELLSGIREQQRFRALKDKLRAFPDNPAALDDYEIAASAANACRAEGIQGSPIDFLICALAMRRACAVFTTDRDFTSYARVLPLKLHPCRS
jgi:predicted nucleic acid-binding protein